MNNIHYYPYASFTDAQMPLLKAAALYFDRLNILNPFEASWETIGAENANKGVSFLTEKEILHSISPAEVLHRFENEIYNSIDQDMQDPEFLNLCKNYSDRNSWTLALAKVPKGIREDSRYQPLDNSMKRLLGDFSKQMANNAGLVDEEYQVYSEHINPFDETRMGLTGEIEYRFVNYPLALGESIMINHAIFAGLLYGDATPVTDDSFHKRIFEYKIKKSLENPLVKATVEDRIKSVKLKNNFFSHYLMTDHEIELPALSDKFHIEDIYKYREENQDLLNEAKRKITQISRSIKETPLTDDFEKAVSAEMGKLDKELQELEKIRDSFLKSEKGKAARKWAGIVIGTGTAILTLAINATPLAPIGLIIAGLGFVKDNILPGFDLLKEMESKNADSLDNGLHYFINLK